MKTMVIEGSMGNLELVIDLLLLDIRDRSVMVDPGSWGTPISVFFFERIEETYSSLSQLLTELNIYHRESSHGPNRIPS
jgi:hypothetical protein